MQAAAGPPVFKLLKDRLAVGFECFASPLNATFARFGSAFPDVDGPFGSAGSFFRWARCLVGRDRWVSVMHVHVRLCIDQLVAGRGGMCGTCWRQRPPSHLCSFARAAACRAG